MRARDWAGCVLADGGIAVFLAGSSAGLALQFAGAGVAVAGMVVLGRYSMGGRMPPRPGALHSRKR